jgi:putative oxidoreductase
MSTFFATDAGQWGLFVLRLTLGLVILPHGLQKLFGWFGGYGFKGTMGYMTGTVKLPWLVAFTVIVAESFGALGLIFGLLTPLAAIGVGAVMIGAAWTAHRQNGFFMNWTGQQKGEGFEFHILAAGIALVLVIFGGGALSVDSALFSKIIG